jgi:hypothetical protein
LGFAEARVERFPPAEALPAVPRTAALPLPRLGAIVSV